MSRARATHLRAVTLFDINEWAKHAKKYLEQAAALNTASREARFDQTKFFSTLPWDYSIKQEIKLTNLAAESYRIGGENHYHDSAKAYAHSAALYADVLEDPARAADYYTEAGSHVAKSGTDTDSEYFRQGVTCCCDASDFNRAAMLQERIANDKEKKQDFSAAIDEYHRATKLYNAANIRDGADRTLGRAAILLASSGKFLESAEDYENLAQSQIQQNTKVFNVAGTMLRSGVMLLRGCLGCSDAANKTDLKKMKHFFDRMCTLDCRFEQSRELKLLRDSCRCVLVGDLDHFVDCIFHFNEVCEFDDVMIGAFDGVKDEIMKRSNAKE